MKKIPCCFERLHKCIYQLWNKELNFHVSKTVLLIKKRSLECDDACDFMVPALSEKRLLRKTAILLEWGRSRCLKRRSN